MPGTGKPVHYIVPDGFRGPLYVVEDPSYDDPPFEDGRYVFRFPESGVLFVKSLDMFGKFHTSTAEWSSGAELYWHLDPPPQGVAIRGGAMNIGGGSSSRDPTRDNPSYMNDFVGTEAEFLEVGPDAIIFADPDFLRKNGVQAE